MTDKEREELKRQQEEQIRRDREAQAKDEELRRINEQREREEELRKSADTDDLGPKEK